MLQGMYYWQPRISIIHQCGKNGHFARNCPENGGGGGGGGKRARHRYPHGGQKRVKMDDNIQLLCMETAMAAVEAVKTTRLPRTQTEAGEEACRQTLKYMVEEMTASIANVLSRQRKT